MCESVTRSGCHCQQRLALQRRVGIMTLFPLPHAPAALEARFRQLHGSFKCGSDAASNLSEAVCGG